MRRWKKTFGPTGLNVIFHTSIVEAAASICGCKVVAGWCLLCYKQLMLLCQLDTISHFLIMAMEMAKEGITFIIPYQYKFTEQVTP